MATSSRRVALRATGAAALGISSLALPRAAAAASASFTTGLGDADLRLYVDTTSTASWSGSGGTWADLSVAENDLTVGGSGQPTFSDVGLGISGGTGAFVFDGTDAIDPGASFPAFTAGTAWSIAAWVRFSELAVGRSRTILGQGNAGTNAVYFQLLLSTLDQTDPAGNPRVGNRLGVALERGGSLIRYCYAPTAAEADRWYHVVATADAARMRLYVDREIVREIDVTGVGGSLTPPGTAFTTRVGDAFSLTEKLTGAVPFLQAWTRALTTAEVQAQYDATRAPYHPA